MAWLKLFSKRNDRGETTRERQLAKRVDELEREVADLRRQLDLTKANLEASNLQYKVKAAECDKLSAVNTRDLLRVKAEAAVFARQISDSQAPAPRL